MNISHLIVFLVRAFAICLAIYSINSFLYAMLLYQDSGVISKLSVAFPASIMIAGIVVWFLPYSVSRVLAGGSSVPETKEGSILSDQLANIAFMVLAMYLIFQVLSDGGYWLYYYLNFENYEELKIGLDAKASIFATVLEALFVVLLILGRQKIFYLFKRLRS